MIVFIFFWLELFIWNINVFVKNTDWEKTQILSTILKNFDFT